MADTDLRMGGVGGGGLKNLFWPFRLQFGPGIRGWGRGAPLDPPLYLAHIWEYLRI